MRFNQILGEREITAYRLAKDAGLNERIVGHWKAGERYPSYENLLKLAEHLDVSLDYLAGRTDNPKGGID